MGKNSVVILAGFGEPRTLDEVERFLRALLTDQEMVRTPLPRWLHRLLFSLVAKVRTRALVKKYLFVGGHPSLFYDEEALSVHWSEALFAPVIPFHRYLPSTHRSFLERLKTFSSVDEVVVFPLYPQYSCVTTGSLKVWMKEHVPESLLHKFRWIDSYATHPVFIDAWVKSLRTFLEEKGVKEEEAVLLFSAHSLPQKIVNQGDPYEKECQATFHALAAHFPKSRARLSYQSGSRFGRWLEPSTEEVCLDILSWNEGRRSVIIVPISFTTDHIETLHEIEVEYLPLIRERGLEAYRCPVNIAAKLFSII